MMIRLLIALATAAILAAAGVAYAGGLEVYIDAPGAYDTTCAGGVVGVVFGDYNDVTAECAWDGSEHVICGGGEVDWLPGGGDQIVVTCEAPK